MVLFQMEKICSLTYFSFSLCSRMSTKDLSTYVPIFDGTNYKEWYDKLEAFAMAMKCDSPMTKDPPAGAADLAAFNIIDQQLQGMIRLGLGATYQSHIGITAKHTLTTLKTTFGTPERVGALVEMRSMFQHRMKPNSNPVHEAITSFSVWPSSLLPVLLSQMVLSQWPF